MATCPKGHESTATDYCDECGTPMGGVAAGPDGPLAVEVATPAGTGEPCPKCGTSRTGRFCEVDGYDFLAAELDPHGDPNGAVATPAQPPDTTQPKPGTAAGWRVVVTADRAYYDRMRAAADPDAEDVAFPAYCPERRFALVPPQALIGRLSRSRGIEPEIDLTGPPADPAVSHSHAILVVQPDGGWAVVDLGSANGTYLNDSATAIEPNLPVPVADGDRVHVGAWSTLILRAP
jgi:hypothetical protein